jgi:FkbM family methyltransferase
MKLTKKVAIAPKVILKSRELIKNWYYCLIDYLVFRSPYIKVKFRDNSTVNLTRKLYISLIYYYYRGYKIKFSSNNVIFNINNNEYIIPLSEVEHTNAFSESILALEHGYMYNNGVWEKNNIKFKHFYGAIYEVFDNEDYKFLNVQNKSVLDIGAFVGDSPIYFILKGAKKVYAIEPHPESYKEMIENIKLNNMENKIIPINMGINYDNDYIFIPKGKINIEGSLFKSEGNGIKIPAGKLSDIIDKYNIDAQVLKMDCEGCEYDIILKDYDTIKEFEEIGFEYHAYNTKIPVSKLLEKLNKDFECRIIEEKSKDIGLVHCIRKK